MGGGGKGEHAEKGGWQQDVSGGNHKWLWEEVTAFPVGAGSSNRMEKQH